MSLDQQSLRRVSPAGGVLASRERDAFDRGYATGRSDAAAEAEARHRNLEREWRCWPVPPDGLRLRVSGDSDRDKFLGIGQIVYADLKRLALIGGRPFEAATSICDFGCGPGRVLRFIDAPQASVTGIDIDPEAIAWCRANLGEIADFDVGAHAPPLARADRSFDLIYAVSVFTHLPEDLADAWLIELDRVLQPGGVLIATFLDADVLRAVMPEGADAFQQNGFYYSALSQTAGLPAFYGLTFHRQDYVTARWNRDFDIVGYYGRSIGGFQDAVVCRKRG